MAVGDGILSQRRAQGIDIEAALGQGIVEAAPAAAVRRLQAEVGQRADRLGGQQGIAEFEQGVSAAREAAVQVGTKGAEGREVISGHSAQRARRPRRWPTRPTTAPPWVKSQAGNPFQKWASAEALA